MPKSPEEVVTEVIDYFDSRHYPLTLISISNECWARGLTYREIGSLPEQILVSKGFVRQAYVKVEAACPICLEQELAPVRNIEQPT